MIAIRIVLAQELREALRRKTLLGSGVAFAALMAAMTAASASAGADAGFGPAAATLINILMISVPLLALVLAATSVARDRERGTLAYVRSLPVRPRDIFVAKAVAVELCIAVVLFAGFAGAVAVMGALRMPVDVGALAQFAGVTWLLALACGALGFALSCAATRTPAALGAAILAWLLLVIFADIGIMTSVTAFHVNENALVALTLANPVEAFKIAALCALSGSVDVLGPGGRLATDTFGTLLMPVCASVLALWAVASFAVAVRLQVRADA